MTKTSTILDALDKENGILWSLNHEYVRFTYADFVKIMHKNDLCTDPRTARQKWQILTDMGIFQGTTKYNTIVNLNAFFKAVGKNNIAETHTRTHTHKSSEAVE